MQQSDLESRGWHRSAGPIAGLLGPITFVIDKFAPELIMPSVPSAIKFKVTIVATSLGLLVWGYMGWHALVARTPPPWWCSPPWRLGEWLAQRPRFQIVIPAIEAIKGLVVLESARATLTLRRNLRRTRRSTRLDFHRARLTLTQRRGARWIVWIFVPDEEDGALAESLAAGADDNVLTRFRATGFPRAQSDLIDFARPYALTLHGATAIIGETRPLKGLVPPAYWSSIGLPPARLIHFPDERYL